MLVQKSSSQTLGEDHSQQPADDREVLSAGSGGADRRGRVSVRRGSHHYAMRRPAPRGHVASVVHRKAPHRHNGLMPMTRDSTVSKSAGAPHMPSR